MERSYSPLSPSYSYASKSPMKCAFPHLYKKSKTLNLNFSQVAGLLLLLSLIFTYFSWEAKNKSSEQLDEKYGGGKFASFVKWFGSKSGVMVTLVMWVLFVLVLLPFSPGKEFRQLVD